MVGLPVCEALGLRLLLDGVAEEVVVEVEEEEAKDEEVCFFGDDVSAVVPAMVWKLSSSTMSMTTIEDVFNVFDSFFRGLVVLPAGQDR
jgi:hypothetical protein